MRVMCSCFVLLVSLSLLGGCNIVGGVAQGFAPPEKVPALHKLANKPTLIVVDDPRNLVTSPATLRRIASSTRSVLEAESVVSTDRFIGQDKLAGYREELGERYNRTSLAALALRLEAKQVIHAEVTGFQMELGGNIIQPAIAVNVKVFDLDERKRVFPVSQGATNSDAFGRTAYPLQSRMPARDLTGQSAARSIAVRNLADQTGRDIARLFFTWRREAPGANLGNRE